MARSRPFRPVVGEALEDRAVPTGLGGFLGGLIGGLSNTVPVLDARQVSQDFRSFTQSYNQAVSAVFQASTTANIATNWASFNTGTLPGLITNLNSTIDQHIANLSTASTLDTTISGELTGTGSTSGSLQSLLSGIPAPTTKSFGSLRAIERAASGDVGLIANQVTQQVRTATAPAGTISSSTLQQALNTVLVDFQSFGQSYSSSVKKDLLPSGTTTPTAQQISTFNGDVATELATLNTSIDSAVGTLSLPASNAGTLETNISNALLGSGSSNSLQSRLAGLPATITGQFYSTFLFKSESNVNIGIAKTQVLQDIATAVSQYNASL